MQEKKNTSALNKVHRVLYSYIGILLLVLLLFSSCNPSGLGNARYSIKGRVTTLSTSNEIVGLQGVNISVKGSSIDAVTDKDGYYVIDNIEAGNYNLTASKDNLIFIPEFSGVSSFSGASINVQENATNSVVNNANFIATEKITIAQIQGKGHISPLVDHSVVDVEGVITSICTEQKSKFTEKLYDGSEIPQVVSEDGFYMQMITPDGDPLTSDGIFVSTRDLTGAPGVTKWLDSCKIDGVLPKVGDIVKVTGVVKEFRPVSRFNSSADLLSRTQINAIALEKVGEQSIGNGVLLTYTEHPELKADEYRVIRFDERGLKEIALASAVFESCEGMLVRVDNPIVVGGTYYNLTGVMADGGQGPRKDGTTGYPEPFNKDFLAPVVRENDFNTEIIYVYYDWVTNMGALPQIGTILNDDKSNKVLHGNMDYSADGNYIIYPIRNIKNDNVPFYPHRNYKFSVNPDSFYTQMGKEKLAHLSYPGDSYKAWLYPDQSTDKRFSVPWEKLPLNSKDPFMNVAVYNLENYVEQGSNYDKCGDVVKVITESLKCPDIVFIVEMGDDDNSDKVIYNNQNNSWISHTGLVSAHKNFVTLVNRIKKESGIPYDFRQIDPIEFDQAGAPGNNIRVGFIFRTDRILAYDTGLPTNHLDQLLFEDEKGFVEIEQVTLAKANAIPYKDERGTISLTQSPGYIQNDAFYHSRIPLICKFVFTPTKEKFFAIACHLYAKGGDAPLYGEQQPPAFGSVPRRGGQTEALYNYLKDMLAIDPDAKIIVAGDMNDFGFTTPIKQLTGEIQGNQILYSYTEEFMPEDERFSYYFRGNLQQLDHIFVTENLFKKAGGDPEKTNNLKEDWRDWICIPHVDSPFSRNLHIQITDHDPVAAKIDMSK